MDIVKIWVDDRNGRAPQLSPALYGAVIDAAHERDLRVNAHVFYHADAEGLVAAGIDGLVHLVRDVEMSDALIAEIVRRNVYVNANMSSPRRATQVGTPPWLTSADPMLRLLTESVAPDVIAKMEAAFRQRDPPGRRGGTRAVRDPRAQPAPSSAPRAPRSCSAPIPASRITCSAWPSTSSCRRWSMRA